MPLNRAGNSPEPVLTEPLPSPEKKRREKAMHHFRLVLTIVVVSLVVIWATNYVGFLGKVTGQQ